MELVVDERIDPQVLTDLRIEWRLSDGMVTPEYPIHLDGIVMELGGDIDAIFASETQGDQRVPCASMLMLEGDLWRETRMITRKTSPQEVTQALDMGWFTRKGNQLDTNSGADRNYMIRVPSVLPGSVVAGARARLDALRPVLANLEYIGGMRRLGFGAVVRCEISIDETGQLWRNRVYPWAIDGGVVIQAVPTAPYFDRKRKQTAWLRGWEHAFN